HRLLADFLDPVVAWPEAAPAGPAIAFARGLTAAERARLAAYPVPAQIQQLSNTETGRPERRHLDHGGDLAAKHDPQFHHSGGRIYRLVDGSARFGAALCA